MAYQGSSIGRSGNGWRVAVPALLLLISAVSSGWAQEAPSREPAVYPVERTAEAIRIDGELDEAVWRSAPTFELNYETRPAENQPPPVRTEVWITYDSNNFYAAFRAHDPDPDAIRARLSDRDNAFADDFVGLVLDTFNDERRAFEFFVNPLGVQMDLTQNEMTGNEDSSWDAIWDSAGRITETGYDVELRIPFSSLRFPRSNAMTWGIDAVRIYPRDQRYRIGLNALDRSINCYLCQGSKLVGLEGISPARSIELDPTVTSSMTATRAGFPDGDLDSEDPDTEAGLTARWGITPNLMLNGAINPDFSQVEADVAQLDVNTQFALFYPEKRPFFLEGADLFETRFNAIYSRNIAEPEWGVKLTGKMGKDAIGAIITQDRRTNFLVPSSQSSRLASLDEDNLSTILRYRRDLFGSTTGGFFYTGREGDGFHNRVLGGDILFRWNDSEAARIEILGSQSVYPEAIAAQTGQTTDEISDYALRAVYQHTSRNWMYYGLVRDVGEDFRADLGFVPQADFRELGAALERAWYPENSRWSQFRIGINGSDYEDHGGQHLQRTIDAYGWAQGPKQSFLEVRLTDGDQFFNGETFSTDRVFVYGEIQAHPNVYAYAQVRVGDQVDYANTRQGEQLRLDPGFRLNLGRHLRLNLNHSYEALDVDGGRLFTANLTQVRATYQFNVRTFVRWVGQHLDVDRNPALYAGGASDSRDLFNQLLFSYKLNPFTVLFLGYSDTWLGDSQIDLTQESRTLFFKVGYAWML
ncbi:MAG TPA: DUF5916 domain-containing protein [Thermoanaerobaculia bacterium]|nr:DUF5916 domain-containing protein [Thermoanaerobaculia bacterium]